MGVTWIVELADETLAAALEVLDAAGVAALAPHDRLHGHEKNDDDQQRDDDAPHSAHVGSLRCRGASLMCVFYLPLIEADQSRGGRHRTRKACHEPTVAAYAASPA